MQRIRVDKIKLFGERGLGRQGEGFRPEGGVVPQTLGEHARAGIEKGG